MSEVNEKVDKILDAMDRQRTDYELLRMNGRFCASRQRAQLSVYNRPRKSWGKRKKRS